MKIALDPAMLSAQPIGAVLDAVAEAGYRYVELGCRADVIPAFEAVRVTASERAAIRRAAESAGVEIASIAVIQAWSSPDDDLRARAVGWWRDGIAAASDLGCTRINTELSGDPDRPAECRVGWLRSIEELLPILDEAGIEVVAEPHPGDFVETTVEALDLVRDIGSDRLRYLHCLPHTYYLGGTATDQIEGAQGWFDHVHVADTYRPGRTIVNPRTNARIHQHFDVGKGELNWPEIAKALQSIAFDGVVTVQVFGWDERAPESFKLNRNAVDRLFREGRLDG